MSGPAGERDLLQIAYLSEAAGEMSADERQALADGARAASARSGLTGVLLRHGAHYYGVVEGPRRRVLRRIEEVIVAQGGRGVRILREEEIAERRFATWSYAEVPAGAHEARAPSSFLWRYCGLQAE